MGRNVREWCTARVSCVMPRRLDELKLLNIDRWRAHLQNRAESEREGANDNVTSEQPVGVAASTAPSSTKSASIAPSIAPGAMAMHRVPVPTAGELFNRPDPSHHGHFVKPYNRNQDAPEPDYRTRRMWVSPNDYQRVDKPKNPANWMETRAAVPTSGDDFTSVPLFSPFKYRVPVTSVTRKQGDCRLFFCCGWRWTAVGCAKLNPVFVAHTHTRAPHTTLPPITDRRNGSGRSILCASSRTPA